MKTISCIILTLLFLSNAVHLVAQDVYKLQSSKIHFYAGTPVEDIEADNLKATSFLNIKTGEVIIAIPNKEFTFKNALMQEHFNENYMESEKFPKSEFKGKIQNIAGYDLTKPGKYTVKIEGTLTIHGVAKPRTLDAVLTVAADKKIAGETKFNVLLADHTIQRPQLLWEKLSESVEITAFLTYQEYIKK